MPKKNLKSPQWLRNIKLKKKPFWKIFQTKIKIIKNGGWHFNFLKDPSSIKKNCFLFSPEYNKDEFTNIRKIEDKISRGKDLFDRNINTRQLKLMKVFLTTLLKIEKNLKIGLCDFGAPDRVEPITSGAKSGALSVEATGATFVNLN